MVNFIKQGDIFNLNGVRSYAHGCNCAGAMGKGIALQFRERYLKMYAELIGCFVMENETAYFLFEFLYMY